MNARQVPGQMTLTFDVPVLPDELRAELAAHVVPGWQSMGACRSIGDDTWFPGPGDDHAAASERAVQACGFCPVRRSCLAHALATGEDFGVWGGTTEVQRDALRVDLGDGMPVLDQLDRVTLRPALEWRKTA